MNHQELIQAINSKEMTEDRRRRAFILSMIETLKDVLIEKGIISEAEYNKYYDKNLKRNFSIKN